MKLPLHSTCSWRRWLFGLALAGACACAAAGQATVKVVLSENSEIYQAFFTTLQKKLGGSNIRVVAAGAQEPAGNASLIVVVGVRAANELPIATNVPVLYALVPRERYETLARLRRQAGAGGDSAIYLEQPMERQLRLLIAALPGRSRVGILTSAATSAEAAQLAREGARHNLKIYTAEVSEQAGLPQVLPGVLEKSDVLLALPDTSIYNSNTIRNLLFSCYRSGKPMAGFSAGLVKAGAIAAVYSTPEQFGEEAAILIRQFVSGGGTLPPPRYSRLFEVSVNKVVASSLGIDLKDAHAIEQEMAKQEEAEP